MKNVKNMGKTFLTLLTGMLLGAALFSGGVAHAAEIFYKAIPSTNIIYLDGQRVELAAFTIDGSNYVKLRYIGQAAGFGITYDAVTNTVCIHPDKSYEPEVTAPTSAAPAISQTSPSAQSKNADGSINVPQDGSQYVPQAGDVIRCDDGTNYTITDVSWYDKNYFADGPVGPLPTTTSQFDQPELPKAEVRRFNDPDGDYIFIRNLHETRRMLYSL